VLWSVQQQTLEGHARSMVRLATLARPEAEALVGASTVSALGAGNIQASLGRPVGIQPVLIMRAANWWPHGLSLP
jgi:hypothetical protein